MGRLLTVLKPTLKYIVTMLALLGMQSGTAFGQGSLTITGSIAAQLKEGDTRLSAIADTLNGVSDEKRGEIVDELSQIFLARDFPDKEAKSRFSWVACQVDGWTLDRLKAIELRNRFLDYSISLAIEKSLEFRYPTCASLNEKDFYFNRVTNRTERIKAAVCGGTSSSYLGTDDRNLDFWLNKNQEIENLFSDDWDVLSSSQTYFSYYSLLSKLRKVGLYVEKASISDDPSVQEDELRRATRVLSDILNDPQKLQNTRNGWRLYPAILLKKLIYSSLLGDEKAKSQLSILGEFSEYTRYLSEPENSISGTETKNIPEPHYGLWPTAKETHDGNFDYLRSVDTDSVLEGLFQKVSIIDGGRLTSWGEDEALDVAYVTRVFLDRLFPGAQTDAVSECAGWKRRSYDPNQISSQAHQCISKVDDLAEFDRCFNDLEARDWWIQFATYKGILSNLERAEEIAKNLNTHFQQDEDFSKYFKDERRKVIARQIPSRDRIRLHIERKDFSTSEVTELRRLMNSDFLDEMNLPLPLFRRPELE